MIEFMGVQGLEAPPHSKLITVGTVRSEPCLCTGGMWFGCLEDVELYRAACVAVFEWREELRTRKHEPPKLEGTVTQEFDPYGARCVHQVERWTELARRAYEDVLENAAHAS